MEAVKLSIRVQSFHLSLLVKQTKNSLRGVEWVHGLMFLFPLVLGKM